MIVPDARKCRGGHRGRRVQLHEPQLPVAERRGREAEAAAAARPVVVLGSDLSGSLVVLVVAVAIVVQQILLVNVQARGGQVGRVAHYEETAAGLASWFLLTAAFPGIFTQAVRGEKRGDLCRGARARALGGQHDHGDGRGRPGDLQVAGGGLPERGAAPLIGQGRAGVPAPPLIGQHGRLHGGDAAGRDKRVAAEAVPTLQRVPPHGGRGGGRRRRRRRRGGRGGAGDGVGVVQLAGEGGDAALAVRAVLKRGVQGDRFDRGLDFVVSILPDSQLLKQRSI